jgi:ApaG protein
MEPTSEGATRGVQVEVKPEYLPEQSDPSSGLWVHAYHVTISNRGEKAVQLLSRHWVITNAEGSEEHVRGPGVVGPQPVLKPGDTFTYTSGCPLDTPIGTMHGTYQMVTEDGEKFDAEIAPFTLAEPYALN